MSIQGTTTSLSTDRYTSAFILRPTEKKWGGITWLVEEITPRTMMDEGFFVLYTMGTSSGSWQIYLVFCLLQVRSTLKSFSSEKSLMEPLALA